MIPEKIISLLVESETVRVAAAGAAGGVVRWLTLRESWKDGLAGVAVGALSAVYLAPHAHALFAKWFGIAETNDNSLTGFVIGLAGMALTGLVIDTARRYRRATYKEDPDA